MCAAVGAGARFRSRRDGQRTSDPRPCIHAPAPSRRASAPAVMRACCSASRPHITGASAFRCRAQELLAPAEQIGDQGAHVQKRRSRYVMIAGRGYCAISADLRGRPFAADQGRSRPDLDVLRVSFALMLAEPVLRAHPERYVLLAGSRLPGDNGRRSRRRGSGGPSPVARGPSSSSLPA